VGLQKKLAGRAPTDETAIVAKGFLLMNEPSDQAQLNHRPYQEFLGQVWLVSRFARKPHRRYAAVVLLTSMPTELFLETPDRFQSRRMEPRVLGDVDFDLSLTALRPVVFRYCGLRANSSFLSSPSIHTLHDLQLLNLYSFPISKRLNLFSFPETLSLLAILFLVHHLPY
jgi:hypothetical protein